MADDNEYRDRVIENIGKHVAVLNTEMGAIQTDVAAIKVDLSWLKGIAWWQLGLLGSLLLGSIGYILFG